MTRFPIAPVRLEHGHRPVRDVVARRVGVAHSGRALSASTEALVFTDRTLDSYRLVAERLVCGDSDSVVFTVEAPSPLRAVVRASLLTGAAPLYLEAIVSGSVGCRSQVYGVPPWPTGQKIVCEELGRYLALQPC